MTRKHKGSELRLVTSFCCFRSPHYQTQVLPPTTTQQLAPLWSLRGVLINVSPWCGTVIVPQRLISNA